MEDNLPVMNLWRFTGNLPVGKLPVNITDIHYWTKELKKLDAMPYGKCTRFCLRRCPLHGYFPVKSSPGVTLGVHPKVIPS